MMTDFDEFRGVLEKQGAWNDEMVKECRVAWPNRLDPMYVSNERHIVTDRARFVFAAADGAFLGRIIGKNANPRAPYEIHSRAPWELLDAAAELKCLPGSCNKRRPEFIESRDDT